MKTRLAFASLIFACIASGCAGYAPRSDLVGQSRDTLVSRMGQPEREYPSPEGQKLQYPRGPAGSHTYFIYLDSSNRVVRWEQVLTEEKFGTIRPGMTKDQVIDILGATTNTNGLARNRGYVWHYRYDTPLCQSFVIEFTQEDIVRSSGIRVRSGRRCKYVGPG
jgi:hypothetical protein